MDNWPQADEQLESQIQDPSVSLILHLHSRGRTPSCAAGPAPAKKSTKSWGRAGDHSLPLAASSSRFRD